MESKGRRKRKEGEGEGERGEGLREGKGMEGGEWLDRVKTVEEME